MIEHSREGREGAEKEGGECLFHSLLMFRAVLSKATGRIGMGMRNESILRGREGWR